MYGNLYGKFEVPVNFLMHSSLIFQEITLGH